MLIADLQKRAHATSRTKGWWDGVEGKPSPQCVLEKLCLVHAEVTEAVQECEVDNYSITFDPDDKGRRGFNPNPKPVGLPIELADIAIRVADLAEALEIDIGLDMVVDLSPDSPKYAALKEQCFGLSPILRILYTHKLISFAVEAVRDGHKPNLANIFAWVGLTAASFGIVLAQAIEIKMAYNETRPHRHGKVL
jgi:NTP pyrophosphatase (non-canonical NTP hydrolase)